MNASTPGPRDNPPRLIEPASFQPPRPSAGLRWPRLPWVTLASVAAVVATFAAMAYLALARSVSLEPDPAEASVDVRGSLSPRFGNRWLLLPGTHRVVAEAPGYKPYAMDIEVTGETLQKHRVALTPLPGKLTLTLAPVESATVSIDDEAAGRAPGTLEEVEAGARTVTVEAPRYLPFTATVQVRGKRQEETLDVKLQPAWADFSIASLPAGATVSVDGKLLGQTPLAGELVQGERRITVSRTGFKPWTRTVQVEAGKAVHIADVQLAKADGVLEIVTEPRGAAITVDGRYRGESPLSVAVSSDVEHRVTAMKAGHEPRTLTAQVAPDATSNVTLQLEAELATVALATQPEDAELLVDGKPAGSANQRLSLTTTEHELVVRREGYASWRTLVTPRKGIDKHYRITLKTAAQMAAEQAPPVAGWPLAAGPVGAGASAGGAGGQGGPGPSGIGSAQPQQGRWATGEAGPEGSIAPGMPTASDAESGYTPPAQATSAEAQRQADIIAQTLVPQDVRDRLEREAVAQASRDIRGRQRGPQYNKTERKPPPPPATEGALVTRLGQQLRRFEGGEVMLPGRPPARLTRPFYVATREVTIGEFRQFMGSFMRSRDLPGEDAADNVLPAAGLTWEAAAMFCNWLSRQDSLPTFYQISYGKVLGVNPDAVGYRLPTEAEWDFVASTAADGRPLEFAWGSGFPPPPRSGNFADQSAAGLVQQLIAGYDDGVATSAPVGSYSPNSRGLQDLAGNVAEWLHDFHAPAAAAGLDPLGPASGSLHVVRGASWASGNRASLQSLARDAATGTRPDLGFRLARYAQ